MPRIRTVKPEFWGSPDTASVSDPWTRLFYIALWNYADDKGRGVANPKELAGFAFPNDEHIDSRRVRCMLMECSRGWGLVLYKVGGRPYYAIPAWHHQVISHPAAKKYNPSPEEGEPWQPCACEQGKHHRAFDTPVTLRESSSGPTGGLPEDSYIGSRKEEEGSTSGKDPSSARLGNARVAQPLPDDWQPTELQRQMAAAKGIDADHEADQFRAHAAAHGKTFVNPHEAFRYWIGNAAARPRRNGVPQPAVREDEPINPDDILGPETPPYPPIGTEQGGREALDAWKAEVLVPWRADRVRRAREKLARHNGGAA